MGTLHRIIERLRPTDDGELEERLRREGRECRAATSPSVADRVMRQVLRETPTSTPLRRALRWDRIGAAAGLLLVAHLAWRAATPDDPGGREHVVPDPDSPWVETPHRGPSRVAVDRASAAPGLPWVAAGALVGRWAGLPAEPDGDIQPAWRLAVADPLLGELQRMSHDATRTSDFVVQHLVRPLDQLVRPRFWRGEPAQRDGTEDR